MNNDTITLPDGYNGHTVECYRTPIETDGDLVKLRVVGSAYLFRWAYKDEIEDGPMFSEAEIAEQKRHTKLALKLKPIT